MSTSPLKNETDCLRCAGTAKTVESQKRHCFSCNHKSSNVNCFFCGSKTEIMNSKLFECSLCKFKFGVGSGVGGVGGSASGHVEEKEDKQYFLVFIHLDEDGFEKTMQLYIAKNVSDVHQQLLQNKSVQFWLPKPSINSLYQMFRTGGAACHVTVKRVQPLVLL